MRHEIRLGLILAAAMTVMSAGGARADQWCGYATHHNAIIQCGYTTASDCESAVGKGGMCFVDPDVALFTKRANPATAAHFSGRGS